MTSAATALRVGLWASIVFVIAALGCVFILTLKTLGFADGDHDPLQLRLLLSSTTLFIAVAFAALGFGLFLINAQGTFSLTGSANVKVPSIATNAPGLVVMLCATAVVFLALRITFDRTETVKQTTAPATDAGIDLPDFKLPPGMTTGGGTK